MIYFPVSSLQKYVHFANSTDFSNENNPTIETSLVCYALCILKKTPAPSIAAKSIVGFGAQYFYF